MDGFHPHEGALGSQLRAHVVDVVAQDGLAAVIAERPQALLEDSRAGPGILLQRAPEDPTVVGDSRPPSYCYLLVASCWRGNPAATRCPRHDRYRPSFARPATGSYRRILTRFGIEELVEALPNSLLRNLLHKTDVL